MIAGVKSDTDAASRANQRGKLSHRVLMASTTCGQIFKINNGDSFSAATLLPERPPACEFRQERKFGFSGWESGSRESRRENRARRGLNQPRSSVDLYGSLGVEISDQSEKSGSRSIVAIQANRDGPAVTNLGVPGPPKFRLCGKLAGVLG